MLDRNKIPKEILQVMDLLVAKGYLAYLVGGCLRDILLGICPKDYDLCTNASPEEIKKLFPRVVETGIRHGTVTVLLHDFAVEITTFRTPSLSPEEDVKRRDFTINALLFDGNNLIDYVGGLGDLQKGCINAVGDPDERFREDPLRMFRAVRLSANLGFVIDESTFEAIIRNSYLIKQAAPERIRDELIAILTGRKPAKGIRMLNMAGLLEHVLPELTCCYGFEQHNPHHTRDVFEHIMTVLEKVPASLNVRLAALLHDIGKPVTFSMDEKGVGHFYGHELEGYKLARKVMKRLKFDNKTINAVSLLVKEHMNRKIRKEASLKRLMARVRGELLTDLFELQIADEMGSKTSPDIGNILRLREKAEQTLQNREPFNVEDLKVNGRDLIEAGIPEGADIGLILKGLLDLVLESPGFNTREQLLKAAVKIYQQQKTKR